MEKETKVYTRRDSATACLKKLGVRKENYNEFITKHEDDEGVLFEVNISGAEEQVLKNQQAASREERRAIETPPPVERRAGMADLVAAQSATAEALKETVKTLAAIKHTSKKTSKPRAGERTVSSVARALVVEGLSNEEIWKQLKHEFKLDASKKHYPSWYRSEARRKGLIK